MSKKLIQKGFTLIELLVVISIISLLSSIILASVVGARDKAIGAKLLHHIKDFQIALELYKNEKGVYPDDQVGFNYYEGIDASVGFGGEFYSTPFANFYDVSSFQLFIESNFSSSNFTLYYDKIDTNSTSFNLCVPVGSSSNDINSYSPSEYVIQVWSEKPYAALDKQSKVSAYFLDGNVYVNSSYCFSI